MKWHWRVDLEREIMSDHFPIEFGFRESAAMGECKSVHCGWKKDTYKEEYFIEALEVGLLPEWDDDDSAEE